MDVLASTATSVNSRKTACCVFSWLSMPIRAISPVITIDIRVVQAPQQLTGRFRSQQNQQRRQLLDFIHPRELSRGSALAFR